MLQTVIFSVIAILYTILVQIVDVQTVIPKDTEVGFATLNLFIHEKTGVNRFWYDLTEWCGMIAILTAGLFAIVGLVQLIQRKSLKKVDKSLFVLAGFYVAVLAVYAFFEVCIINYRPVLMEGELEASYPSSHTMLVICLMVAAVTESRYLIKNRTICRLIAVVSALLATVTVAGRLVCGVHWFTDILGGILISAALVSLYGLVLHKICQEPM